jgi:hypothetical protein
VKNKYFHFGKEELNQFKNFLEITCPPPSPTSSKNCIFYQTIPEQLYTKYRSWRKDLNLSIKTKIDL